MPQKIKILRASTAASVPPVTLEQGELAVNALASPPELWTRGASGLVNLIESVDLQTVLADYLPLTGGTLSGPGNLNVFGRTELKGDVQVGEIATPRALVIYGPLAAAATVNLGNVGYEVNLHGSAQIWNAFTIRSAAVFNCSAPYTQTISSDGDTGAYTSGKIQVRNLIGSGAGAGTLRLPGYGRVFTIDTITGQIADLKAEFGVPLQLAGNATQPLHAVPLQQLNAAIAGIAGGGASVTVSVTAPVNPTEGDLWFDSTDTQLYVRYGTAWVVSANMIGPDRAISGGTF